LGDDGKDGERARARLRGHHLAAPELIDLEVAAILQRSQRAGRLDRRRAEQALSDLADIPLSRSPHLPLIQRVWELRSRMGPYQAAYAVLAERLGALLLTADVGIARVRGLRCRVELLDEE
jgi:predicted nucleic acid-binding protein